MLEAAQESRASIASLQYPIGEPPSRTVSLRRYALHVGRILYGNIGGGNRLDFTCIGPAVNLAARLEKIASQLGRTVVASKALPASAVVAGAISASFRSRDFPKAARVYGLADEKSAGSS